MSQRSARLEKHQTESAHQAMKRIAETRTRPDHVYLAPTPDSGSRVNVDATSVEIIASENGESMLGITIDANAGTSIHGPVGISSLPWDVRFAGFFCINPLSFIPSTLAFPVPTIVFNPPLGATRRLAESMASIGTGGLV